MARLELLTLAAEDWYETLDFYHELLGLPVVDSDEVAGRARLRVGEGLLLEIHSGGWGSEGPKMPAQNPVSLCLRVEDVSRLALEMESCGACFLTEPSNGVAALMDPEGNRVYLYDTEELPRVPDGWELEKQALP